MDLTRQLAIKRKNSFGSGKVDHFHPEGVEEKVTGFSAILGFTDVLKLKAAVDEAAATMNRQDRRDKAGRRAAMWLHFSVDRKTFTVGPQTLEAKDTLTFTRRSAETPPQSDSPHPPVAEERETSSK